MKTALATQFSEIFVFIQIIVKVIFFNDVQLDGIESDDFQVCPAFFTRDYVALVRVGIDMDIHIAFGACSGRHFSFSSSALKINGRGAPA